MKGRYSTYSLCCREVTVKRGRCHDTDNNDNSNGRDLFIAAYVLHVAEYLMCVSSFKACGSSREGGDGSELWRSHLTPRALIATRYCSCMRVESGVF